MKSILASLLALVLFAAFFISVRTVTEWVIGFGNDQTLPSRYSPEEERIVKGKEALAAEYTQVQNGTGDPEQYRQHCIQFMRDIGEDPTRHPACWPTPVPSVVRPMDGAPAPLPTSETPMCSHSTYHR